MKKFHIKKGDQVKVISGNHKGKQGQVLEVIGSKSRALVESVNIVKRHTKPSAQFPEGGIIEKEGSIHISNLMLVDASGEPVRKSSTKAKAEVKTATKKPAAKKPAAKKPAAKKPAAEKAAAKKPATKKPAAKKAVNKTTKKVKEESK